MLRLSIPTSRVGTFSLASSLCQGSWQRALHTGPPEEEGLSRTPTVSEEPAKGRGNEEQPSREEEEQRSNEEQTSREEEGERLRDLLFITPGRRVG